MDCLSYCLRFWCLELGWEYAVFRFKTSIWRQRPGLRRCWWLCLVSTEPLGEEISRRLDSPCAVGSKQPCQSCSSRQESHRALRWLAVQSSLTRPDGDDMRSPAGDLIRIQRCESE